MKSARDGKLDLEAARTFAEEFTRLATFEGRIEHLERVCRRHAPAPGVVPKEKSREWYAAEILMEHSGNA